MKTPKMLETQTKWQSEFLGATIPEHALHEKGLQRQIGVGTLVSSQERRALFVLLINRWSNADQLLILFLRRF